MGLGAAGALVAVVMAAAVACGSGSSGAGPDGSSDDTADWVGAELGAVPDGYVRTRVESLPGVGRRVSYAQDPDDDDWTIQVTAMLPTAEYDIERIQEQWRSADIDPEVRAASDLDADVRGHPAIVGPMTSDGRQYGYEVMWEESPELLVIVEDSRQDESHQQLATKESVLALAESVVGMDRAAWDAAASEYDDRSPFAGPPDGAVPTVLATGERDGHPWELTVLQDPERPANYNTCLRLSFAGETTGPGCAPSRVVLAGKGFVLGSNGIIDTPPDVRPGPGSDFAPFAAELYVVGDPSADKVLHAYLGMLPDGACAIEVFRAGGVSEVGNPRYDHLLPGDPGALECAGR